MNEFVRIVTPSDALQASVIALKILSADLRPNGNLVPI